MRCQRPAPYRTAPGGNARIVAERAAQEPLTGTFVRPTAPAAARSASGLRSSRPSTRRYPSWPSRSEAAPDLPLSGGADTKVTGAQPCELVEPPSGGRRVLTT